MKSPFVEDGIKYSIVREGFKLIFTPGWNQYELFALKRDPYEQHDLITEAAYLDRAEDLKGRMKRVQSEDRLGLESKSRPRQLTEEEKRNLRSLGYAQ